eukprot:gene11783-3489_t
MFVYVNCDTLFGLVVVTMDCCDGAQDVEKKNEKYRPHCSTFEWEPRLGGDMG